MRSETWASVVAVAARQHGLVTRTQLLNAGLSSAGIVRAAGAGLLETVRPGVYRVVGVPPTVKQPLAAALLAARPDSAASFIAAAWSHGSERAVPGRVEITVPGVDHVRLEGARVHRSAFWTPDDVTVVDGLRTTTPARTLADLALAMNPWTVRKIFDEFIRLGKVDATEVLAVLDRLGRRHRGGSSLLLRAAVDRFDINKRSSELETQVLLELRKQGVPEPAQQYWLRLPDGEFLLDFAWVESRVALETHGYDPHRTREQALRDAERRLALDAAGWKLFEVTFGINPVTLADLLRRAILGH